MKKRSLLQLEDDVYSEVNQTISNSLPVINTENLIPASTEGCIENYQYFTSNPKHGYKEHNTCGSVAAQLLLAYHNFYSDRRIIGAEFLNGGWHNSTGDNNIYNQNNYTSPQENPNACTNPSAMTKNMLGSNNSFYEYVISNIEPSGLVCEHSSGNHSHNGSNILEVSAGIENILSEKLERNTYSITYESINTKVISEFEENRPVILLMQERLGGINHWVVGYGYQEYTYSDINEIYDGYVVHFGWTDETSVWINSSWCTSYIAVDIEHEHNYDILDGYANGSQR